MQDLSARPVDNVEALVETYGNMLYRICFVMLKSDQDAQDAVQDTFIKYMNKAPAFESPEHMKAWLITVATNTCRDARRMRQKHTHVDADSLPDRAAQPEDSSILRALTALPEKYRIVLTLHYVEENKVGEIAKIIGKTPSAVKMRLKKGRGLLEQQYRKESL